MDHQHGQLAAGEENFKKELAQLTANREELAAAVDDAARLRYERLVKNKGGNVVVGVQHGVCGGCPHKFPAQKLVAFPPPKKVVGCLHFGPILFFFLQLYFSLL